MMKTVGLAKPHADMAIRRTTRFAKIRRGIAGKIGGEEGFCLSPERGTVETQKVDNSGVG